jgi:thioesterase III
MESLKYGSKIPSSSVFIRFPDCDPFGHLNNSRYIDYFVNAREDHLRENYGLDVYNAGGVSWVTGMQHIAYLRPAMLMEKVWIESQMIAFHPRHVMVEMRMLNEKKSELKSLLWGKFYHVDLATGKSRNHSDEFMSFFEHITVSVDQERFETRVDFLRSANFVKPDV